MSFFSIVLPTYNNAGKISRAVNSIINQTYTDWEIIVVDDGSSDNTEEKLRVYLQDHRISFFKQKNKGAASARNMGASKALGEFIIFLDSDDEMKSQMLLDYKKLIDSNSRAGFLSTGSELDNKKKGPGYNKHFSQSKFSVRAGSFTIKKEIFNFIGGYDQNLRQSENWEMVARAIKFCEESNYRILYNDKFNLIYHYQTTIEKTIRRDEDRARATLYLYKKYKKEGVLHFKSKDFLLTSAVNFARSKRYRMSRIIFYYLFKKKPNMKNLSRIIIFELPFLRKKLWMR